MTQLTNLFIGEEKGASEEKSDVVYIYTDGSCIGNPGPGGYGVVIRINNKQFELGKGFPSTTNNQMELLAVIDTLKVLDTFENYKAKKFVVVTDSEYVVNAINKNWLQTWKSNKWRKKDKKPVLNLYMWKELDGLLSNMDVEFVHVKGHAGHIHNERCDRIARSYSSQFVGIDN